MTALDAIKAHLNITDDADDELLDQQLAAAILHTAHLVEIIVDDEPVALSWDNAPADVRQAIMMLAGHWYENREATLVGVSAQATPFGYHDLLLAYRRWVF